VHTHGRSSPETVQLDGLIPPAPALSFWHLIPHSFSPPSTTCLFQPNLLLLLLLLLFFLGPLKRKRTRREKRKKSE
jgi:hypothetical protein